MEFWWGRRWWKRHWKIFLGAAFNKSLCGWLKESLLKIERVVGEKLSRGMCEYLKVFTFLGTWTILLYSNFEIFSIICFIILGTITPFKVQTSRQVTQFWGGLFIRKYYIWFFRFLKIYLWILFLFLKY